jgi:DNA-directed RNA polymerase subunit L
MSKLKSDIKIRKLDYIQKKDGNTNNYLHLEISGDDVNHILINTLRRTILLDIPIYAFDPSKIIFKKNSSVFNNDHMRQRICAFPIININNSVKTIDDYDQLKNKNHLDADEINLENLEDLSMYIKEVNNEDDILNVTTDMAKFYMNNIKIKSIYPKPLLVCKLKKEEEIEFTIMSNLDIAANNSIYSPVSVCAYEELNSNKYKFILESNGQLDEYEIIRRSCLIIINKLTKIRDFLKKQAFTKDNRGTIILENENHTMGNLITNGIQDHPDITFAGYKLDHLLIEEVTIEYVTNGKQTINDIINEIMTKQIQQFKQIITLL